MAQLLFPESIIGPSLPQGGPRTISRDEMNLAEFPLTVLSTRVDPRIKTLEFTDSLINRNGESVERKWIITGADKFGLPTASDDEVLLGLMKLTVDDGFRARKVFFSRYELLRILQWTTEGRSYTRLQRALDRLSGVRIKATNAFFDNEAKSHSTRNFGIIDAYEINDGRSVDAKPSFFEWSEAMFKSFQVGFIKKLDLQFYLGLSSAISKRLYRFLDKHFWYRARLTMNLFVLAHEKVGVSRNYRFASSLRQQIDPALEELKAQGFIAEYQYSGKGRGTEVTVLNASSRPRVSTGHRRESGAPVREARVPARKGRGQDEVLGGDPLYSDAPTEDSLALNGRISHHREERSPSTIHRGSEYGSVEKVSDRSSIAVHTEERGGRSSDAACAREEGESERPVRENRRSEASGRMRAPVHHDVHSPGEEHVAPALSRGASVGGDLGLPDYQHRLAQDLVDRGLQPQQVKRLLRGRSDTACERMSAIVAHFDALRAARSHLISRSPIGFLYRAMERPETFMLPNEVPSRGFQRSSSGREHSTAQASTAQFSAFGDSGFRHPQQSVSAHQLDLDRVNPSRDGSRSRSNSGMESVENECREFGPRKSGHRVFRQGEFGQTEVDRGRGLEAGRSTEDQLTALRGQYLEARKRSMQQIRTQVEPEMLERITGEVEKGLAKLRKLISPARFNEALEHGVEERLARLFVFPEFDEWLQQALHQQSKGVKARLRQRTTH